jgi:glycosyl-4,4'-diaponeurosporenoate acyltransferase
VLIELPTAWVIVLNVAGWPVIQIGLAWVFTRMPARWFNPGLTSRWERSAGFCERVLLIRHWKDHLPDAARWFAGGFAKGTLLARNDDYLRRFIRETWRGELCHWVAMAFAPVFFLWNPCWAGMIMVAYALVANLPCILVQRYNRGRIQRMITSRV